MSRWTIWMLVMVTVALAACQSMSNVKPGDGRKATITLYHYLAYDLAGSATPNGSSTPIL